MKILKLIAAIFCLIALVMAFIFTLEKQFDTATLAVLSSMYLRYEYNNLKTKNNGNRKN